VSTVFNFWSAPASNEAGFGYLEKIELKNIDTNQVYTFKSSLSPTGTIGHDWMIGTLEIDSMKAGAGNDLLQGDAGNDVLYGEAGNDLLIGGGGNDLFVFDSLLSNTNSDWVRDFTKGFDKLVLDGDVFVRFTGKRTVGVANFRLGENPLDTNDFLIYNTNNDMLYYDADGSGTRYGMLEVAKIELAGTNAPSHIDFLVIT
jgi:Ca2+-binding RTX toxin-like protein